MKRLALLISCAAGYFAFSSTFEPALSQARMTAGSSLPMAPVRPVYPSQAIKDATGVPPAALGLDTSELGVRGDQAP